MTNRILSYDLSQICRRSRSTYKPPKVAKQAWLFQHYLRHTQYAKRVTPSSLLTPHSSLCTIIIPRILSNYSSPKRGVKEYHDQATVYVQLAKSHPAPRYVPAARAEAARVPAPVRRGRPGGETQAKTTCRAGDRRQIGAAAAHPALRAKWITTPCWAPSWTASTPIRPASATPTGCATPWCTSPACATRAPTARGRTPPCSSPSWRTWRATPSRKRHPSKSRRWQTNPG